MRREDSMVRDDWVQHDYKLIQQLNPKQQHEGDEDKQCSSTQPITYQNPQIVKDNINDKMD